MNNLNFIIIKCDFDGKVLTFDKSAENLFGCSALDVIGIKRIYNFLHPDFIINFSKDFSLIINKKKFFFNKKVFCLHSDNSEFLATLFIERDVNNFITIKIKKEQFVNNTIKTKVINFDKINLIIRSKFVIGSFIPFFFSIIWSIYRFKFIDYSLIFLIFLGVFFLHVAANTFNDYFDWKSGRDKKNIDYVLFSTGGSRAVDFKIISEKHLLFISIFSFILVFIIGLYFVYLNGIIILIVGLIAFFSVYFYSAPPIHLASRYGLGELMHIFCLGPLIIYGSSIILSNNNAEFIDFFVGFPFGLLITGCLLMNEYPDSKFDKLCGKINLAVVLGKHYIPYMYLFFLFMSFCVIMFGITFFKFPKIFYLVVLMIPYSLITVKSVFKISVSRKFIADSCLKSFNLYFYFSLIFTFALLLHVIFIKFNPW